jgi:hypothetical protein
MVCIGGTPKNELLAQLERANVLLNGAAQALFADGRFTTSSVSFSLNIVQFSVVELGFSNGATFAEVIARARVSSLTTCPLELGPHLRLDFIDQPEGAIGMPASKNCAPHGSVTIASEPLSEDDETPKGFYLRRIEGDLWLRGYRSWASHLWSPKDVFVFAIGETP